MDQVATTAGPVPMNLVIRVERENGHVLICYHNGRLIEGRHVVDRDRVEFYSCEGRFHEEMSLEYYYHKTIPYHNKEHAQLIFKEYIKNWEGYSIPRLRQKLV